MASSYSTMKSALDEIAVRIQSNRKRVQQAQATVSAAAADLAAMQTVYTAIVADINAAAAADPADQVLALTKAEKDKLVAEFQALKTLADTINTALSTYTV